MRTLTLTLLCLGASAGAQPVAVPPPGPTVDVAVLRGVYGADGPAATGLLRAVDASAYPVFLAAVPVTAAATWGADGDFDVPLRLAASEAGAAAVTIALKRLVRRPRPYRTVPGVDARSTDHEGEVFYDPDSFPSGHTSMAFAVATSLSLSVPEWYVVGPAMAWASSMGVARVWLGVHYPTDVLAGALVGAGAAAAVDLLAPEVFGGGDAPEAVPLRLVIPL